jgi:predicted RNA-binding protein associated with RNAse of E/G family
VTPPLVHIHYLRLPDRKEIFSQHLVWDDPRVKVTLATGLAFDPPLEIDGHVALETGSSAVWFTFPDEWHDIGLFHRADGRFVGTYANVLTPPVIHDEGTWYTTDLFLDLWIGPDGRLLVLDRDQFADAVARGWLDPDTQRAAESEVARLTAAFSEGTWPPPIVAEWSLERARALLG